MKVKKAVIPAAGLGTRFLPITKAIPKEMIPIIDRPMIEYIFEEIVQSGIEEIILISARRKEAIENYFDFNPELEHFLESKGKSELSKLSKNLAKMCKLTVIRQQEAMGLGHAVLCAKPAVGDQPFAVLLGDDLVRGTPPCTQQLVEQFENHKKSVVGVMPVEKSEVHKYGVIGGKTLDSKTTAIDRLVEKPKAEDAPSLLVIPGRYVLKPSIFGYLENTPFGKGGELQLTDALHTMAQKEGLIGYTFTGKRYDTGDRLGYLEATLAFGLEREDLAPGLRLLMKQYLNQ